MKNSISDSATTAEKKIIEGALNAWLFYYNTGVYPTLFHERLITVKSLLHVFPSYVCLVKYAEARGMKMKFDYAGKKIYC